MSSLAGDYCNQLKQQFRTLFGAFPPNQAISLGDFGTVKDDQFTFLGNITDAFGVTFDSNEFPDKTAQFILQSEGSTDIEIHAKGDATPTGVSATAGIDVAFTSTHSLLFNAAGVFPAQIENQIKLGNDIMDLFKQGKWQKKFVIVTSLYKGGSTTAIVSATGNSSVDLEASADVQSIDLSDASLKLIVKSSKALALTVVTEGSLTPLFGLSGIQGVFNDDFGPISLRALLPKSPDKPQIDATKDGDFLMFRQIG
jgi:hypothetical protein